MPKELLETNKDDTMKFEITRRTVLRGSVTAGLLTAFGAPLLTACGSAQSGAGSNTANSAVKLPSYLRYQAVPPDLPGDPGTGVMDAFFKYPGAPRKTIMTPPGDGKPITAMASTTSPIPPGMDQNAYWQELNQRLGSPLQMSVVPGPDYSQKFATTVAGDSLPDIFNVDGGAAQLPQLLAAKAVDLTAHLSGDAIKKYPFLANVPTESWRATVFNGKIYGVPLPRGVLSTWVLYHRSDLLAAKGITATPGSFQDFFDLCKELNDPRSNTWALSAAPIDYIRQMLAIPNGWQEQDGKLISANEAPQQKDALDSARKIFQAGLTNPDAFSKSTTDYKKWFGAGKAYMTWDTFSAWPQFYRENVAGASFNPKVMPIPAYSGGGKGSTWVGNPTHSIAAISKKSEARVETLLSVMNYLAAPFGTEEYLFRKYGTAGTDHTLNATDPVLTTRGASETAMSIMYLADAPWPLYQPGSPNVSQDQHQAQADLVPTGKKNPVSGLYSATATSKGSSLGKKLTDLQNDIMQGRRPVSDWDQGVKDWKTNGGDAIRDELQQALQTTK